MNALLLEFIDLARDDDDQHAARLSVATCIERSISPVCSVLGAYTKQLAYRMTDDERALLKPYLIRMAAAQNSKALTKQRVEHFAYSACVVFAAFAMERSKRKDGKKIAAKMRAVKRGDWQGQRKVCRVAADAAYAYAAYAAADAAYAYAAYAAYAYAAYAADAAAYAAAYAADAADAAAYAAYAARADAIALALQVLEEAIEMRDQ